MLFSLLRQALFLQKMELRVIVIPALPFMEMVAYHLKVLYPGWGESGLFWMACNICTYQDVPGLYPFCEWQLCLFWLWGQHPSLVAQIGCWPPWCSLHFEVNLSGSHSLILKDSRSTTISFDTSSSSCLVTVSSSMRCACLSPIFKRGIDTTSRSILSSRFDVTSASSLKCDSTLATALFSSLASRLVG